jgi:pyrroline-5-carboxylate reductase
VNDGQVMTSFFPENPLALLGCGNMGRAMLDGWLAAGLDPKAFVVIDPQAPNLPVGVRHFTHIENADGPYTWMLLGIKPQMFDALSSDIESVLTPDATLISMLAGTRADTLSSAFPGRRIVRIMPNLAAALGKAPIGVWSSAHAELSESMAQLLAPLGHPIWIDDEAQMDAVTALAGSGPAFVYRFIDALAKAGMALGLSETQASEMALAMVDGAASLAAQSDVEPSELAARVTSKGGTTAAGLEILDRDDALQRLMEETLRAARDRGIALAGDEA